MAQLFIGGHCDKGDHRPLCHIEGNCAEQDIGPQAVDGRIEGLTGRKNGINGHDLREEGDQQEVVCQGAHNGNGHRAGGTGQSSPLDRGQPPVDQPGCYSKGGEDQKVRQFPHTAGGGGEKVEQILDEGDENCLCRPHDEGSEQNRQTAQIELEEGRKRREGEFKEHHHRGDGRHQGGKGEGPGAPAGVGTDACGCGLMDHTIAPL